MTSSMPCKLPASRRKRSRPSWFRARAMTACCGLALVLGSPALAHADTAQELEETDARLGGYDQGVKLEKSGVAVTWMLYIVLAVIGCSVMLKNANRSHLD
jgi:hypothetical protein